MADKLLIVQAAALSEQVEWSGPQWRRMQSVFPAVTCTAQAAFRTASPPGDNGMVANGRYFRDLRKIMFWEQSSGLVEGERIWRRFRESGRTVAVLFWQQSLGEDADILLSPAPIHKHHGGMIQDCYGRPGDLYRRLCERIGRPFKLQQYWGPMASYKSGDWIARATAEVIGDDELAPDLCLTYLPTLDYELQRRGPGEDKKVRRADEAIRRQLDVLHEAAAGNGYEIIVFGDYKIVPARSAVFPNRILRRNGLMHTREVRGMLYPDLYATPALAMADHEVAHVYVRDQQKIAAAADALRAEDGVAEVYDRRRQAEVGLDHPNSGELVAVAADGCWFAYPWWDEPRQKPDYADHVDIHNKPGFDPCELFWGFPPGRVSTNTAKVRGTHGRTGTGREVVYASSIDFETETRDLIELARASKDWMDSK